MAVKHPYTGKVDLKWQHSGMIWSAEVEKLAAYRRGHPYVVRESFAVIRPAYNDAGMLDESGGWVVTRNSFDEIRSFSSIEEAKVYVQSLFALEITT